MKHLKRSRADLAFEIFNYTFLTIITILTLYPLLFVLFSSFSDSTALMQHTGLLLRPAGFSLDAYQRVLSNPNIRMGYRNTMFILFTSIVWSVFMTSLGAYFLSRRDVMWKNALMFFFVFTMFFQGGMIPFFLAVRSYGLQDSRWSLVLPFSVSTFNMIIMRTGFQGIPESLEESAMLDGAGHMRILFQIVYPLSKAVIAVMVLFYGVSTWNGWFWASMFIRTRELLPLQVIMREILLTADIAGGAGAGVGAGDAEAVGRTIRFATIVVATVPILLVYPLIQKYFAKGVMIGAVKG
ncbi:MAG: carbohydrate ABC transporter permease [Defluviitaleaceae bacterium]|nr:carbohydrate ABC transporter permease [Defluviitaleaceae bacterium]